MMLIELSERRFCLRIAASGLQYPRQEKPRQVAPVIVFHALAERGQRRLRVADEQLPEGNSLVSVADKRVIWIGRNRRVVPGDRFGRILQFQQVVGDLTQCPRIVRIDIERPTTDFQRVRGTPLQTEQGALVPQRIEIDRIMLECW
jgi:hypothetical protein